MHSVHDSGRKAILFSRTSFTVLGRPSLPPDIDASVFVPITRLKGKNECVQYDFLERYIIENNNDDRVIDIFALVVYETLIFLQSPGYIDAAVVNLIKQIDNQVNPVDVPFCPGYLFYFNFCWTLSPFMSRFEFGPQTYSVMLLIYFIKSSSHIASC